jgi:hypothetical protein
VADGGLLGDGVLEPKRIQQMGKLPIERVFRRVS